MPRRSVRSTHSGAKIALPSELWPTTNAGSRSVRISVVAPPRPASTAVARRSDVGRVLSVAKAEADDSAVDEHPYEHLQLPGFLAEGPGPHLGPVHLGLDAGIGLEAHLWVGRLLAAQGSHPPVEGGVAPLVAELFHLPVQRRGANRRTGGQPPGHM